MNEQRSLRGIRPGFVVAAATLIAVTAASAQTADDGFSLGLGGGFAKGFATPFSGSTIGYYVLPTLEFPSLLRVLRPRADLLFADWGASRVTAFTGNFLFTPLSGKRIAPYALAGAGAYAVRGSPLKSGWTLGLGLRLPGEAHAITIESRVHAFLAPKNNFPSFDTGSRWRYVWAPIGLGIQF
jgi:hypothetical protein